MEEFYEEVLIVAGYATEIHTEFDSEAVLREEEETENQQAALVQNQSHSGETTATIPTNSLNSSNFEQNTLNSSFNTQVIQECSSQQMVLFSLHLNTKHLNTRLI